MASTPPIPPKRVRARPGRLTGLAFTLAACSALTVGCSGVRGELVQTGQADLEDRAVELAFVAETEANTALFSFSAADLHTGTMIEGEDLHKDAPMIMSFVVPGCVVCIAEGPKLAAAAESNPEVNFVVIHSFGDVAGYLDYNERASLTPENMVHLVDTEGVLWERFGVLSQPSTVLLDREGGVTSSRGALGDDGLARAVERVTSG